MHRLCFIFSVPLIFGFSFSQSLAQSLQGKVVDARTRQPLAFANVLIPSRAIGAITNELGEFTLEGVQPDDTIAVSYIGFSSVRQRADALSSPAIFRLREFAVMLEEVSVTADKLNPNEFIKPMRVIRGNLFASETEVTNMEYNRFLRFNPDPANKLQFELSGYNESEQAFYKRYHAARKPSRRQNSDSTANFSEYPAVNIRYESAVAYCNWLTDEYNTSKQRRKYKKVKFRLPTLDEWRIAALGNADFQSWKLEENYVMVTIPKDSLDEIAATKGKRVKLSVKEDVWYPWYGSYNYKKKAQNHLNFFLGNFRKPDNAPPCIIPKGKPKGFTCPPFGDGFSMMSLTAAYFPNDIGLYDVVGNVSEMIAEQGKACGGSWNDLPRDATIWTVNNYTKPSNTVGFRVFMEILEY